MRGPEAFATRVFAIKIASCAAIDGLQVLLPKLIVSSIVVWPDVFVFVCDRAEFDMRRSKLCPVDMCGFVADFARSPLPWTGLQ